MSPTNLTIIPATIPAPASPSHPKRTVLRTAAYCRVSTDHEEQEGSFQNQLHYYTSLIEKSEKYILAGIYADEGISGTNARRRPGFQRLIADCRSGLIDLVITKSISRFARNTQDCLKYTRLLKSLGIDIFFEKENIHSLDSNGELLFTILSSLAQEESRNISENTTWGIRSNFQKGIPHINAKLLLGYEKDESGRLVIQESQAVTVRLIYDEFLQGYTPREISRHLNEKQINGVYDRPNWHPVTIERILRNEKYKGDLLMQKTYTPDYLTKRAAPNIGQFPQYYIKNNHPAIIPEEQWSIVQDELARRQKFRATHHLRELSSLSDNPLSSRCFCAKCGAKMRRRKSISENSYYWYCPAKCNSGVPELAVLSSFNRAWVHLMIHREKYAIKWELTKRYESSLPKFYAGRMLNLVRPVYLMHPRTDLNTLVRMTVEEIYVSRDQSCKIIFLDGTVIRANS